MLLRWRSKCFFDRPSKLLDARKNGGWFYGEPTRPFLQGHGFTVMREYYCAARHVWRKWFGGQCLFESPSPAKPATQCRIVDANPTSPRANAHGFTVERDSLGTTSVLSLFHYSCPPTVLRFVVAVIVNSVNRIVETWLLSHVSQKVCKRLQPSLANCDASSTIAVIVRGARIVATSLHFLPSVVFWTVFSRESACCHPFIRKNRIIKCHLKLLHSFVVVRAARRPQSLGCSHYYARHGRVVQ